MSFDCEGLLTDDIPAKFPDLAGLSAIVSGASRGIGCGIAYFLGRQGMKLTLCARSAESGEAFAQELQRRGIDCQWATADLTDYAAAEDVLNKAVAAYGHVHLLVNNAANLRSSSVLRLSEESYIRTLDANMRMVCGPSFHVSRHMVEAGGGNIVNVSSVGGLRAHEHRSGYDSSKGAMDALTRSMAIDLAQHGIRVNAVAPGATRNRPPRPHRKRHHSWRSEKVPLQRVGTPEEIGAAVAFLASKAGGYITGQVLYVDGGLTAQLSPPGMNI